MVKLATLDGKLMLNWMSGCRINKYHKTLMPDMLKTIHAIKEHKEHNEQVMEETLKESRERTSKQKNRPPLFTNS